jgi:small subunit ribosomal protein S8
MSQDLIADFCTRIRNGYMAHKKVVVVSFSKTVKSLAEILEKEGYLGKLKAQSSKLKANKKELAIELKYQESGEPAISSIKRVSKPGMRLYKKSKNLPRVLSGMGLVVVSTPKGLMTDRQAREKNLGGEILCQVW